MTSTPTTPPAPAPPAPPAPPRDKLWKHRWIVLGLHAGALLILAIVIFLVRDSALDDRVRVESEILKMPKELNEVATEDFKAYRVKNDIGTALLALAVLASLTGGGLAFAWDISRRKPREKTQ